MPNEYNPFSAILEKLETIETHLINLQNAGSTRPPTDFTLESEIEDRYIDKKEAAQIAAVSTSTIDNWARAGKIKRYYFGASVRFYHPELMEYLQIQAVG